MQEIRELIQLIDKSKHITEFEYECDGALIKIKKENGTPKAYQEPVVLATSPEMKIEEEKPTSFKEGENLKQIESPMVGTFYLSPSPEEPSFVSVGDRITENTVVCILEAMKLFNEIKAETKGEIVEILVEDGQLVEFGQPLFLIREG